MSWRLKSPLCKNLLKFVKVASVIFLYPLYIIINIRIKILRHMKMYRLIFPTFEQLRTHVSFNIQCSLTISFGVPVKNRRKLITRRVRYSLQSGFPNPENSEPKIKIKIQRMKLVMFVASRVAPFLCQTDTRTYTQGVPF